MIVVIDCRKVSLWDRLKGAWLLVFRGGFKFDQSRAERGE